MLTAILTGAAAFGFLGSLHCAFMCGPLAVAGCGAGHAHRRSSTALYFGGRALSYIFAGAAFGALGAHIGCFIRLTTLQQTLLGAVAVMAIMKGVTLSLGLRSRSPELTQLGRPSRFRRAARAMASLGPRRALSLGLLTGALPCGLLAGAWSLAAATGHPLHGALVMGVFSAATAPALAASLVSTRLAGRSRLVSSTRTQGLLWCALGLWIVARSLFEHGAHHGGH
jgi:sulfite exporter TauE/SafE